MQARISTSVEIKADVKLKLLIQSFEEDYKT